MPDEYEKSLSIQNELSLLTGELASELQKSFRQRNSQTVQRLWSEITRYRPRLNALNRSLRKLDRQKVNRSEKAEFEEQRNRIRHRKRLAQRLALWDEMNDLVQRHVAAEPALLELYREENPSDAMLTMFHKALHRLANPHRQSEEAEDYGCFPDIPLRIQLFDSLMLAAYRLLVVQNRIKEARFLDVGCGGGTKVFAARRYFSRCDGLEYDHDYARAGQQTMTLLEAENCTIRQGDGLVFDGYQDYDVIYFYRPLREDERLAQMEKQILSHAQPGTVVLAPYDMPLLPREGFPAARIIGPVFVAGMTQGEADDLHEDAKRTSPEVLRGVSDFSFDTGFWQPLLDATRYNGVKQSFQ